MTVCTERGVVLAVPLCFLTLLLDLGIDFAGINEPSTTEILVVPIPEEAEEDGVNRHPVLVGEVADDPLRAVV